MSPIERRCSPSEGRTRIQKQAVAAALAVLLLIPLTAGAAVTAADYERAMGLRARYEGLTTGVAEEAHWIDGRTFYYQKSVKGGHEYVLVDAEKLEKRPAFDHARMAAAFSKATGQPCTAVTLPFSMFMFTEGGKAIMVMDPEDFGTAWRCDLSNYTVARSGRGFGFMGPGGPGVGPRRRSFGPIRDLSEPMDTQPVLSPDGRLEAFIYNYNLAVRAPGAKDMTLLSTEGSEGDFYDIQTLAWSPDSKRIAVYRVKPGYQRHVEYVVSSPADQVQPKHISMFYPKPGDVVDVEQPVLFEVGSGMQTFIARDLFPNAYEMSDPVWRRDGRGFTFEYNQRGHQVYRIIEVEGSTGRPWAVISDEPKTFFYYARANSSLKDAGSMFRHDLDDGREIIWMSERDGWKHLYLYDGLTGQVKNRITQGEWVVRGVVRVDEKARRIWFTAGGAQKGQDPYFRQFYRVDFDGSNLTALTTFDADHAVSMSPDGRFYVDTYSRIDMPPVAELHRASDGALVMPLEKGDITDLLKAGWRAPESFKARGRDGRTDIYGIIVRPSKFDPKRKYPVIENIYAGPQGSFVPKSFVPFAPHSGGDGIIGMQSLAELGFIVVQIDGMGTANRSKAFHDVCWKNLGDAGFPDRILWHKAVAAKYPWYDISRVGIYGGSAGGQNAMGALLFHPEFYKAAVAFAGCHDNRMDKISWNEQWMGWPIGPEYSRSSNVDNAWRLQGKLLLAYGELDNNVDPSSTMQVVNALVRAGKDFDLLVVPNGSHGAGRSAEAQSYGDRKRFDFFVRNLLHQETPTWNESK